MTAAISEAPPSNFVSSVLFSPSCIQILFLASFLKQSSGIATRLLAGRSGVRIPAEALFSLLLNFQTGFEAYTACYLRCNGVLSRRQSCWNVRLYIHLHLMLRFGMNGAVPSLPLYAFTAWTGTTLSSHFYLEITPPLTRTCNIFSRKLTA